MNDIDKQVLPLPDPRRSHDATLQAAFEHRQTTRRISQAPLSRQMLSDVLWAACGVNRMEGPFGSVGRTVASASNSQEIDVYVALREGAFLYDAQAHQLNRVASSDLRRYAMTPGQQGVDPDVPLQLIYVADIRRLTHTIGFQEPGLHDPEIQKSYYYVDAGMIGANVYLFCAGEGLAAWFHNCDRHALAMRLGLREEQRVLFAQSVGYPENI